MISYFVRYECSGTNMVEFKRHYRSHHAGILKRLPGITGIVLHDPLIARDPHPTSTDPTSWLAQMTFDSEDNLARALLSEARNEARADFHRFPPVDGNVYHQAYSSEFVFDDRS